MFYHFFYSLRDVWFGFNLFRYITFRAAFCGLTSFLISILLGPWIIKQLGRFNVTEHVLRREAPSLYKYHQHKEGTPTMGGIILVLAIIVSTLLWADLTNRFMVLALSGTLALSLVGFVDDIIKLKGTSRGLRATAKLTGQFAVALVIGLALYFDPGFENTISFPFFKDLVVNLGVLYILFVILVIAATSNAVNITDGLDGLAIGCIIIMAVTYAALSYITGHAKFSSYLNIFYNPHAGELAVFCAAILGSCLGFLWYNSYPATIFMGDTGSLALGGAIGLVAVFIKKELLLFLVGGIFVWETITVLLQVGSFKLRKKRIFLMAPIHHHYQLKGWPESKIIIRFWIIAIILALITMVTLKIR